MPHHTLTPVEEEALRKLSNAAFDHLSDAGLCEERADALARKAVEAARKALEDGE